MPQNIIEIELEVDPISGHIREKKPAETPPPAPKAVLPLRKNLLTKEFNLASMGADGLEMAWEQSMAAGRKAMMLEREYPYCPHCGRQGTLQVEVPMTDAPDLEGGFTSSWFLPTVYYMKVFIGCPDLENYTGNITREDGGKK